MAAAPFLHPRRIDEPIEMAALLGVGFGAAAGQRAR